MDSTDPDLVALSVREFSFSIHSYLSAFIRKTYYFRVQTKYSIVAFINIIMTYCPIDISKEKY